MSDPYSVTLLRSMGPRLAKRIEADGTSLGYEDAKHYSVSSVLCRDLPAIRDLLLRIGPDPRTCKIRGELIDASTAKYTERCNANFAEVPRCVLALDADEAGTVDEVVSSLPPQFHGVSYVLQWTGSYGFKPGARCRLFYLLDKPLTGPQVSRWLTEAGALVDHSVFRRVQPIYTAFPVLAPGVADPTGGKRVEIVEGDWPDVSVPAEVLAYPAEPVADGSGDPIAATCTDEVRGGMLTHLRTREYPKRHDGIGSWMGDAILAGLGSDEIATAAATRMAELDPERTPQTIAGEIGRLMEHQQRKAAAGSLHMSEWARAIVDPGAIARDMALPAAQASEAKQSSIVLRTHADRMRDRWEPRPMLVAGLLPADGLAAAIAQPGKGKSLILAHLAAAVAAGAPFAGREVQVGRVIYACPDSPASTERRLLALPASVAERVLTIPDLPPMPASVGLLRAAIAAENAKHLDDPVRLLLIDTWDAARSHSDGGWAGQDGLVEAIMRDLRRLASEVQLAVLLAHHATRSDGGRARGSIVFDARCDWIAHVEQDEGAPTLRLLSIKARDGECGPVGLFHIEPQPVNGQPVPVLRWGGDMPAEAAADDRSLLVLRWVVEHPDKATARGILAGTGLASGSTLTRAADDLRARGLMESGCYLPTEAGRQLGGGGIEP